jgi:hypothetical protein
MVVVRAWQWQWCGSGSRSKFDQEKARKKGNEEKIDSGEMGSGSGWVVVVSIDRAEQGGSNGTK